MQNYILRRLIAFFPVLLAMTVLGFGVQQMMPGGPVEQRIQQILMSEGGGAGDVDLQQLRKDLEKQFGMDKPIHIRYFKWLSNAAVGDFGQSTLDNRPALDHFLGRIPVALFFGIPAFLGTYLLCIPLGITKAVRDGSRFDSVSSMVLFVAYSTPPLVLGLLLLLIFCTDRVLPGGAIFPLGGAFSRDFNSLSFLGKFIDIGYHMFLPVLTYLAFQFTATTQLMKNSFLEAVKSDFVRTARAKGLAENIVLYKHTLRNAVLPLLVNVKTDIGVFLAGSILIESVFGIPGIGKLFIDSIAARDYNVMMLYLVLQGAIIIVGQLVSDLLYVAVDPRIDFS